MRQAIGRVRAPTTRALLCVLAALSFGASSHAQTPDEPLVQTEEPGTIITHLLVPATQAEVLAILDDPYTFGGFTPDLQSMDVEVRGRCKLLSFESRGLFEPLRYSTQRCPWGTGWRETLLESDSFTRYDADIQLLPVVGGTRIIYRLSVGLDLPVPDVVISKNVKRSARLTMQAVRELLLRTEPAQSAQDSAGVEPAEAPPLH